MHRLPWTRNRLAWARKLGAHLNQAGARACLPSPRARGSLLPREIRSCLLRGDAFECGMLWNVTEVREGDDGMSKIAGYRRPTPGTQPKHLHPPYVSSITRAPSKPL